MKSQDLIVKLRSLNSVEPDAKFLNNNRELLLSQIENSGIEKISSFDRVLLTSENLARLFSKPAFALGAFVLVLFGANFVSSSVLEKSKPNDSLYIARVISERVKVNTTLNQEARERLAINYALRHAEDLASILSDEKFNNEENSDQLAKLSNDFINEVNKVESSLSRLSSKSQKVTVKIEEPKVAVDSNEGEALMVIADNSKDDNGIEIYIPEKKVIGVNTETKASSSATSLEEFEGELIIQSPATSKTSEAKELVEKKDYDGALNKLNEAVESIKK